jgi:hypothetical protein
VVLGATQQREAQSGQGCGKGTASPAHPGSGVGNQRPRGARELAGQDMERGKLPAAGPVGGWSGPVGGLSAACQGRHHQPSGRRPLPLDGAEQGRGEKREGGREEPRFK